MAWADKENRYQQDKVYDACGLFGFIDTTGSRCDGNKIVTALCSMKERGNGLGSGYAAYGLYPEFSEHYCFHTMNSDESHRLELDTYLRKHFAVVHDEPIPHKHVQGILDPPVVWRYFLFPQSAQMVGRSEEDYIVHEVMYINSHFEGSFVVSSGKNMGIFKGVGHPEAIAEFYQVQNYQAYLWTAHNRFPTNTPGWWGGAHPFGLLDWSVVHNGEISSYGINRRYIEQHGYCCTMRTDTEVFAYAADLLIRRHQLPLEVAAAVFASPLWSDIDRMPEREQRLYRALRQTYGRLLMNGPFTIILAKSGVMMGLGDRIRLRPLVAGIKGNTLYISSEMAAIYLVEPDIECTWLPEGGEPVIGRLGVTPQAPHYQELSQATQGAA